MEQWNFCYMCAVPRGMVMSLRVFASLEKQHLAEQGYHVVPLGATVPHVAIDDFDADSSRMQFSIDNDAV